MGGDHGAGARTEGGGRWLLSRDETRRERGGVWTKLPRAGGVPSQPPPSWISWTNALISHFLGLLVR